MQDSASNQYCLWLHLHIYSAEMGEAQWRAGGEEMKARGMEYRGRAEEKEREGEIREEGKERGDKCVWGGGG